ncbi:MAG: hypothetical protein MJ061_05735 [Mailhella sp.]|nr:hypothetical protein [Mailhella sp.]
MRKTAPTTSACRFSRLPTTGSISFSSFTSAVTHLACRAGWADGTWEWSLGGTDEISRALHVIPLTLKRI